MKVQIYIVNQSPALHYVCDFIFNSFFKTGFELIERPEELNVDGPIINYSEKDIASGLQIIPKAYLFQKDLLDFPVIDLFRWDDLPAFYKTNAPEIPFDLFSAIFFFISRAEEYNSSVKDKHGRFHSKASVFNETGIIERPLVDEWLLKLKNLLEQKFPGFSAPAKKFKWINSYDIDVAYAYKHRSFYRWMGASGKDVLRLNFKNLLKRLAVTLNLAFDHFDTYDFQREIILKYKVESKYFFLLGDYGLYDRNLDHTNKGLISLIQKVEGIAEVGIHPSYASHESEGKLNEEIRRLRHIVKRDIRISRQHFLKFDVPSSYRRLIASGIKEDYSLAYADKIGFRAGTCSPFYFFDLEENRSTDLKIIPLTVMDSSLRDYMCLSPAEANNMLQNLIQSVKDVQGSFVSLWHNETLSDKGNWKGWKKVYEEMAGIAGNSRNDKII